ncbi:M1 family metallopeptidase [Moheibacter sediminis]|uniref:Aminopeptidase N n=1 Tax=Moheibacter sediminis TaxID=1434700 RepID=A0A1W2A7D6_9FLAO|nr:M1 family metallopeptidase [Moheibacter sediminis]SMC56659.1 Por secretion system C-terminal sorting domain-containing protein [Moheibacter sediminis]
MKLNFTILFCLGFIFSLAQRNYEHSIQEKNAFQNGQHTHAEEGVLLDADYVPEYYRLEIHADPNVSNFSGKTTMHFTTTELLNQIKINAKQNLDIESISYHSAPITNFTRSGDVLTINLPASLPQNHLDSIAISFSGNANTSSGYSVFSHNGNPIAETISESFHASAWWVCKDDLLDKVKKIDIHVTHPSSMKAASNGLLKSVTNIGGGNSVSHWQHNYPIPVYLVAIAVTNYIEYNNSVDISGTNVPIINYVYPESLSGAQSSLDQVPSYISSLSEKFGDYPYKLEKYGHAEWERGGGMEHSTMSFVANFDFGLVVHELGHQWFGNQVTCGTWSDIWLNEGFAEYSDGLMTQEIFGENAFKSWKEDYVWYITDNNWGSVWNPEPENEDRIFNYRLTYAKASMMVHLIRYIINDDALFYQSMKNYLNDPALTYGYATTPQFKSSLEASTGMNWDNYFADWIYGQGHPIFNIAVNKHSGSNNITVIINQNQSHNSVDFFETPLEIQFRGSGGQTATRRFNLTQNGQSFDVTDLSFAVTNYTVNPSFDVVCRIGSTTLGNEELDAANSTKASIYPNPANESFTIENKENIDEIKVFDVSGKVIYHSKDLNNAKVQINSQNWTTGTYMVQIQSGNRTQLMKVLVK